jgi:arsenate reductase (glutaredoxin)
MADIEIYLYSSCTSCRKAEEVLKESGVAFARRDYFKQRFSRTELEAVLAKAGVTPSDILSTRSTPYKTLELEGKQLSDDQLLDLMIEHPQLLRRPLVIKGGTSTIGFNAGAIAALIGE